MLPLNILDLLKTAIQDIPELTIIGIKGLMVTNEAVDCWRIHVHGDAGVIASLCNISSLEFDPYEESVVMEYFNLHDPESIPKLINLLKTPYRSTIGK